MKIKNGVKLYSFDEVFKKDFKSKSFQKSHDEEMVRLKLSYQLRQMRIAKKLTQKMVAKRAQMPQSVLARLESGTHSFSLGTLDRVARVFNKKVQLV